MHQNNVFHVNKLGEGFSPRKITLLPLTQKKIKGFENAQYGWDYGRGVPASSEIISSALHVLEFLNLSGFYDTDAFLGREGEILISAYEGENDLEVVCETNGLYSYSFEIATESSRNDEMLSYDQLTAQIVKASGIIWKRSYFSSTHDITTAAGVDTGVQRSAIHRGAALLSFALAALPLPVAANASTYTSGIRPMSQVTPLYLDGLQRRRSHLEERL